MVVLVFFVVYFFISKRFCMGFWGELFFGFWEVFFSGIFGFWRGFERFRII